MVAADKKIGPWGQAGAGRSTAQNRIAEFASERASRALFVLSWTIAVYVLVLMFLLWRPSIGSFALGSAVAGNAAVTLYLDRAKTNGVRVARKIARMVSGSKTAELDSLMQLTWAILVVRIAAICGYAAIVAFNG